MSQLSIAAIIVLAILMVGLNIWHNRWIKRKMSELSAPQQPNKESDGRLSSTGRPE